MNYSPEHETKKQGIEPSFEPFLPVAEAAAVARMSKWTLWRGIRLGQIPAYGAPGWLRVRLCDVLPRYTPRYNDRARKRV
jgi:hypothetical protein